MRHALRRHRVTSTLSLTLLSTGLGLAGTVLGQEVRWPRALAEQVEVNVVNVEVVVTDQNGRPVHGLDRDAFELLEEGEQVEITNFFEVAGGDVVEQPAEPEEVTEAGGPSAEERALNLLVYVDNANLSAASRGRVLSDLRDFLRRNWRDDLRVMLVSNDRELVIRQGFTTVRAALMLALDQLESGPIRQPAFANDRATLIRSIESVNVDEGVPYIATKTPGTREQEDSQEELTAKVTNQARALIPQLEAYAQQRFDYVSESLLILGRFVEAISGLPGRKAVLYVSDGLPLRPGEEMFEAYAQRFDILGDVGASTPTMLEARRYDTTPLLRRLARQANAGRVSLYTLDASLGRALDRGGASSGSRFFTSELASIEADNLQASIQLMARETGGRAALTPASWETMLLGILSDFDNYYSLGYPAPRREPEQRNLTVRLTRRTGQSEERLQVRHRSSFRDRTIDEQMASRTLSALLVAEFEGPLARANESAPVRSESDSPWWEATVFHNPLGVRLTPLEQSAGEKSTWIQPLRVEVPLGKLVLIPGETEHRADLAVYVAARDEEGRTSAVTKHLCPIRIPNSEILVALGRTAACGIRLGMREGRQAIAVSVHDRLAATTSTLDLLVHVGPRSES